jgi:hypothetical protein
MVLIDYNSLPRQSHRRRRRRRRRRRGHHPRLYSTGSAQAKDQKCEIIPLREELKLLRGPGIGKEHVKLSTEKNILDIEGSKE